MMSARMLSVLLILSFAVTLCGQTAKQIELLKQYAGKGSAACSYRLAEYARAGKLSKDKKVNDAEYTRYFNQALNARYPKARLDLAVSYLTGRVTRNQQLAYDILDDLLNVPISRDFSKENLFEAYYWMGYCLEQGKGCSIDTSSAYFYYRLASIVNTKARFAVLWHLGREKDKNIPLDYLYKIYLDDSSKETVANIRSFLNRFELTDAFAAYLERKAKAGDSAASMILALNQWNGELFVKNQTKALKNFERAAQYGDAQAALKLAEIYSKIDLGNVKGLRKINLYAGYRNIPEDFDKAEYYAKKALFADETRKDASLLMIQLLNDKLRQFKTPPANYKTVDLPKISKSGPPLPPVPGRVIPAGRLNKMGVDPAIRYRKLRDELFYYHMQLGDYKTARKLLNEDGADGFHPKDIYLKAKEFRNAHDLFQPGVTEQYKSRIRMAANAGYPLAVYEYYLSPEFAEGRTINYSKLIEAALQMPYPEQSQWHWLLGTWFLQPGADHDPAQALACIRKAADMGNPDALEYLMQAYMDGNPTLQIRANKATASKYRKLLLKHDTRMTKYAVFADYLKTFKSTQPIRPEDFDILFRAAGHSPLATCKYAEFYFTGNKSLKINKNPEHGLNLLHFAMNGNITEQVFAEIQKRYPQIIGTKNVDDLLHYEQKMLPLYKKLR